MNLKSILTLGDSLTNFGYQPNGWVSLFKSKFPNIYFINKGINGFTSSDYTRNLPSILSGLNISKISSITIWLGTNDVLTIYDNPISTNQFKSNINAIISYFQYFNIYIPIYLISIPINDFSLNEWIPYEESIIKKFNIELEQLAKEKKINYIDLNEKTNKIYLTSDDLVDGVHFNDDGNLKIYNILKEFFNCPLQAQQTDI